MKTKSVITLVVVILLLAVLAVFSLGVTGKGVTIGITRFKPWYENVKALPSYMRQRKRKAPILMPA